MTYVDLRPDDTRMVWVERAGEWHLGELEAYRETEDGWVGSVRYAVAPGEQYIGWLPAEQIRRGVWVGS